MEHSAWLSGSLVYLAAAMIAVPVARFLGLGSIIGYLGAGILIGPWGLKLVTKPEDMLEFAEFGVVLMLFLVGLELEPQRLWSLRKPIFGWGSVQLFGSGDYSMRIWLNPEKIAARNMTADDVVAAIRKQNVQVAAGVINGPPYGKGGRLQLPINVQGRLSEPEEFENIVVKRFARFAVGE